MKIFHRSRPLLLAASLVSLSAIGAEPAKDDTLLMGCSFRPRDAVTDPITKKYKVAYVSAKVNLASGNVDDLRLQNNDSLGARRLFAMQWGGWDPLNGNKWKIQGFYFPNCMTVDNGYVNARSCNGALPWYLTMDDGYYVIHAEPTPNRAWKADNPNLTNYLPWGAFKATDPLSTRRKFHWRIIGCKDLFGNNVSPAP